MNGYLRIATEEDMQLLYGWANDPLVRENSFTTKRIAYEEHKKWFRKILASEDCRQYIYMYGEEAVGQIRVILREDAAEIGYSICREKRGQGHGSAILQLVRKQVALEFPGVRRLVGKVKPNNTASKSAFLNAGFQEEYSVFEVLAD